MQKSDTLGIHYRDLKGVNFNNLLQIQSNLGENQTFYFAIQFSVDARDLGEKPWAFSFTPPSRLSERDNFPNEAYELSVVSYKIMQDISDPADPPAPLPPIFITSNVLDKRLSPYLTVVLNNDTTSINVPLSVPLGRNRVYIELYKDQRLQSPLSDDIYKLIDVVLLCKYTVRTFS